MGGWPLMYDSDLVTVSRDVFSCLQSKVAASQHRISELQTRNTELVEACRVERANRQATDVEKINLILNYIAETDPSEHVVGRVIDRLVIQHGVMSPPRTATPAHDKVHFSR